MKNRRATATVVALVVAPIEAGVGTLTLPNRQGVGTTAVIELPIPAGT